MLTLPTIHKTLNPSPWDSIGWIWDNGVIRNDSFGVAPQFPSIKEIEEFWLTDYNKKYIV